MILKFVQSAIIFMATIGVVCTYWFIDDLRR